jgi:hypothetical protein
MTDLALIKPETEEPETEEQRKLRELKTRRRELVAAREAAADALATADEIAREERAIRDEEALQAAIAKHGPVGKKLATVETDLGLVILQRPSPLKFRRFQDKGEFETDDVLGLVRPCVVYPSPSELDALLDELPATLARLANAVVKLAGQRAGELGKK